MIYNFDDQVKQLDKKFVHISNKKLSINKNVKIYLNKIIKKLEKEKCSEIMNMELKFISTMKNKTKIEKIEYIISDILELSTHGTRDAHSTLQKVYRKRKKTLRINMKMITNVIEGDHLLSTIISC